VELFHIYQYLNRTSDELLAALLVHNLEKYPVHDDKEFDQNQMKIRFYKFIYKDDFNAFVRAKRQEIEDQTNLSVSHALASMSSARPALRHGSVSLTSTVAQSHEHRQRQRQVACHSESLADACCHVRRQRNRPPTMDLFSCVSVSASDNAIHSQNKAAHVHFLIPTSQSHCE
jgi:hypothetical protein